MLDQVHLFASELDWIICDRDKKVATITTNTGSFKIYLITPKQKRKTTFLSNH